MISTPSKICLFRRTRISCSNALMQSSADRVMVLTVPSSVTLFMGFALKNSIVTPVLDDSCPLTSCPRFLLCHSSTQSDIHCPGMFLGIYAPDESTMRPS